MRKKGRTLQVVQKKRRSKVIHIDAAGGLLMNSSSCSAKVLLIKRNGKWDLPKGKKEVGESNEECALREVEEETGMSHPVIQTFLCNTYHEFFSDGRLYGKTTCWYSMLISDAKNPKPQFDEGITETKWVKPETAIEMVDYDNLKDVLETYLKGQKKRRD